MKTHRDYLQSMFTAEGDRKYVTSKETRRFLRCAKTEDPEKYLLCMLLAYTGCRVSEAVKLTTRSLDFETKSIIFLTLKQRSVCRYRQVPVPPFLLKKLLLQAAKQSGNRIWHLHRVSAYRWVHEIMGKADLYGVKASPKGLRHGFAISCLEENVPFPLVSKWLGHASLRTTAIYSEFLIGSQTKFAERRWSVIET